VVSDRYSGGVHAASPFSPYEEFHAAGLRVAYYEICAGNVDTAGMFTNSEFHEPM